MRIVLIGEAPSRNGDSNDPLNYGCFSGLKAEKLNLFDEWPGENGKASAFPMREARERAELAMYFRFRDRSRPVVFVGKRVALAFGFKLPYFKWSTCENGMKCAVFPHPSGINRWWNDEKNRKKAARFLRQLRVRL